MKTIDCNKFNKDFKKWSGLKKKKNFTKYICKIHKVNSQNFFGRKQ